MAFSPAGHSADPEARHSEEWYGDLLRDTPLQRGDRMFIRTVGGPCLSRLEAFPTQIEIPEKSGICLLVDDGPPEAWAHEFVASIDR
jgi:hypothetical protein